MNRKFTILICMLSLLPFGAAGQIAPEATTNKIARTKPDLRPPLSDDSFMSPGVHESANGCSLYQQRIQLLEAKIAQLQKQISSPSANK